MCDCYFRGSVSKVEYCPEIVVRSTHIKFHENLSSECCEVPASRGMYRQT
jgi:hypothetical protein